MWRGLAVLVACWRGHPRRLEAFVKALERSHDYVHVNTPSMAKRELYELSGHWAHYQDDMYAEMELGTEQLVLRPMPCPHHILIFGQRRHSWRELPLRLGEAARCSVTSVQV